MRNESAIVLISISTYRDCLDTRQYIPRLFWHSSAHTSIGLTPISTYRDCFDTHQYMPRLFYVPRWFWHSFVHGPMNRARLIEIASLKSEPNHSLEYEIKVRIRLTVIDTHRACFHTRQHMMRLFLAFISTYHDRFVFLQYMPQTLWRPTSEFELHNLVTFPAPRTLFEERFSDTCLHTWSCLQP